MNELIVLSAMSRVSFISFPPPMTYVLAGYRSRARYRRVTSALIDNRHSREIYNERYSRSLSLDRRIIFISKRYRGIFLSTCLKSLAGFLKIPKWKRFIFGAILEITRHVPRFIWERLRLNVISERKKKWTNSIDKYFQAGVVHPRRQQLPFTGPLAFYPWDSENITAYA